MIKDKFEFISWSLQLEIQFFCQLSSYKYRFSVSFLVLDCLGSLGVADRNVIPDSRITASSNRPGYPAKEARLLSTKGWCAIQSDKSQFVQIDLGQVSELIL